ncbi:MAG: phage baseplate protein [Myxococcota bacterium]
MEILWEEDDGGVGRIWVDATVRESHQSTAEVTDHPVERGVDVADHVRIEPDEVVFDVWVSNTPTVEPETQMDGIGGEVRGFELDLPPRREMSRGARGSDPAEYEDVEQSAGAQVLAFDAAFNRARRVHEELRRLQVTATLVQLITPLREYEDMVLRSITAPREGQDGITFAVEARQIRTAESEIVDVPIPESPRGRQQKNEGPKSAEEEEDEQKKNKGLLVLARDKGREWGFF